MQKKPTKLILAIKSTLLCLAIVSQTVEAQNNPTQMVEETIEKTLFVLKAKDNTQAEQWAKIGEIIDQSFDFRSMSQSLLSQDWKIASSEERRLFVSFFSQYLEDTYRNKLSLYTEQSVVVLNEQVRKDRAVVETEISNTTGSIQVTYRLKNNGGDWFVYDVLVSGVGVVNQAREMFDAIVKAEGIDGLRDDLKNRVNVYKEKHGQLPFVP